MESCMGQTPARRSGYFIAVWLVWVLPDPVLGLMSAIVLLSSWGITAGQTETGFCSAEV